MSSENLQDAPTGEFQDDSYVSRPGTKGENIGVQADSDPVEDPIDAEVADTDEQLGKFPNQTSCEPTLPPGIYN